MDILTRIILCALAVFRLAEMFVIDDGPFGVFVELRGWLQRGALDNSLKIYVDGVETPRWISRGRLWFSDLRHEIFSGITCVYCVGMWLSLVFTILFYIQNIYVDSIIIFLAIAGLQSIFAKKLGRH